MAGVAISSASELIGGAGDGLAHRASPCPFAIPGCDRRVLACTGGRIMSGGRAAKCRRLMTDIGQQSIREGRLGSAEGPSERKPAAAWRAAYNRLYGARTPHYSELITLSGTSQLAHGFDSLASKQSSWRAVFQSS